MRYMLSLIDFSACEFFHPGFWSEIFLKDLYYSISIRKYSIKENNIFTLTAVKLMFTYTKLYLMIENSIFNLSLEMSDALGSTK